MKIWDCEFRIANFVYGGFRNGWGQERTELPGNSQFEIRNSKFDYGLGQERTEPTRKFAIRNPQSEI